MVLPHSSRPERCPVISLPAWLEAAGIGGQLEYLDEPEEEAHRVFVFRPVHPNGTTVAARGMSEAAINNTVQRACARALGAEWPGLDVRPLAASRLRHLRPPAGRLRPGHRPPDPPPLPGLAGPVHPGGERLGGQCGYGSRDLSSSAFELSAHHLSSDQKGASSCSIAVLAHSRAPSPAPLVSPIATGARAPFNAERTRLIFPRSGAGWSASALAGRPSSFRTRPQTRSRPAALRSPRRPPSRSTPAPSGRVCRRPAHRRRRSS